MTRRKLMSLCLLGLVTTARLAEADKVQFTNAGRDSEWTNAANWHNTEHPEKQAVPGPDDEARIPGGNVIRITSAVTVGYFRNGTDGGSQAATRVILDGGTILTVGTVRYNSACYRCPACLTVQNGGSATFNSRFLVGFEDFQGGSLVIQEGTVRVANTFHHNENYTGAEDLNTRTTINPGGLLDVDELVLNAGVMDIAGGTLIIRRSISYEVNQWIIAGRIIPMGGAAGWKIKVTVDEVTGWTTLIAEPVTEPFTVGRLNPAVSFPLAG